MFQYLFVFLGQRSHTVSVDIRTAARSQPVLVKIEHCSSVHYGISVHSDVLKVVSVGVELSS